MQLGCDVPCTGYGDDFLLGKLALPADAPTTVVAKTGTAKTGTEGVK